MTGQGGHGAYPYEAVDPIPPALAMAQAFSSIVSRNTRAKDELVISVTQIHTGSADNVIPESAYINATIRTFSPEVQAMVQKWSFGLFAAAGVFGIGGIFLYGLAVPAGVAAHIVAAVLLALGYRIRTSGQGLVELAESL